MACIILTAALKHGIWKRKRKWNTESNINDRKLKNFTLHNNLVQYPKRRFDNVCRSWPQTTPRDCSQQSECSTHDQPVT